MSKDPSNEVPRYDIRAALKARLEELGISQYAISQEITGSHPQTALTYLYSVRDAKGSLLEELIARAGLELVPAKGKNGRRKKHAKKKKS